MEFAKGYYHHVEKAKENSQTEQKILAGNAPDPIERTSFNYSVV